MRLPLLLVSLLTAALLTACGSTDNAPQPTPLTDLKNAVAFEPAWRANLATGGIYRFAPDADGDIVYMASAEQGLAGYAISDGRRLAEFKSDRPLAGGLGADKGLLVVGTLKGEVLAYDVSGKQKWLSQVSSEIVAPPVVSGGVAVVRSVDGRVWGLNAADGKVRWQFQRSQPPLILRNYAPVTVADSFVYVGLAGGRLAALALADGKVLWESAVAQPKGASELERVADVASAPAVDHGQVCAVAFQGRVACFAANNGSVAWARDVSSYAGLAIDASNVYVTDETGNVLAYERSGGRVLWKQEKLYGRRVSAPAVFKGNVVVGDLEGIVHVLSIKDGSFLARQKTDGSPIVVAPRDVAGKLIVQTSGGGLYAFNAQ